jgi:DNA replication protein DnaC
MSSFRSLRDRDAWSTIRGYVYQVDLTIQRWLDLAPNQILELECGEDIDIVSRALIADSEECNRLLEQVKHRDESLTLRKPEAIAAIACFIEHCQTNPNADIIFQFTTNTKVGRERLSPIPDKVPAIEAWERLRLGELQDEDRDKVLEGIRKIIKNARKPDDLHQDTWQKFCDFRETATNEAFLNLVRKFQWITKAPEARSLKSILQQKLLEGQHAIDPLQAQEQYQRLFWYVFSRLCERGKKQLILEELHTQIALPSLSQKDHETLEILKTWSYEIDDRVSNLENEQQQNSQLINHLSVEVRQIARSQGVDQAINYVVETPILDIYPLVERSSLRGETVQSLAQTFINHTWIAINGTLGSGKTQLAVLLVQYLISQGRCTNCVWLRLRDLTVQQACLRFDQAVEALVEEPLHVSLNQWYTQICNHLGANTILVFDDLPQFVRGDDLETRLIHLAQICYDKGIRLLSTSSHQLSQNLQSVLGGQILYTTEVPPFTNSEAADIFRAYDAPEFFLNSSEVAYLNSLAHYHPSLLSAIANYLNRHNWQVSPQTLDALIRGEYATFVNEETLNHILLTIQDDQSQELLYRLNLVLGYFSPEDMQALANVAPSIERPRQRLNNLLGVWIQRDVNNRLMVSPLVKQLGSQDLSISVRQECHFTLGERIIRSKLNQYKVFNAIFHFTMAEAFNKAGSLLLSALNGLEKDETQIDDGGILTLWSQQPLPEQMDLGLRLIIRGFQISVRVRYKITISYLLDNLDNLMEEVTTQETGMVMALVANLISKCPNQVGFFRLNRYFRSALSFSSVATLPDGSELSLPHEVPFESLIWAATTTIQSAADLEDWIATLEHFTSEQRERAFSTKATEAGCLLVAEWIWLLEADKPEAEQDWQTVLTGTRRLKDFALSLGLELLWASAICSEVIILAEYNRNLNQAIEIIELSLAHASNDPRVQFLLKECLGRQFVFAARHDEAVTWLTQALVELTDAYPLQRLHALLRLSRAIAAQEPYLALQYAQQAVNVAQSFEEIPETELVKALGELAIAKWLAIDVSAAFEAWDQAGEYLLNYRRDKNEWKDLFVLYAHITGYFTAVATTGNPPGDITEGEIYAAPARGIFLTRNLARVDYYNPSRDCFLPTQLASFAEAIGNDKRAFAWALKGLEMARDTQQFLPLTSLGRNIIPQLVLKNSYADVLDLAVEVGTLLVALPKLSQAGGNILEPGINIQEVFGLEENEMWKHTESCALILGVLPIIFHIANIAIYQPGLARTQAIYIAAMCREIAAISRPQSLWTTVVEIIDQIHLQQSSCIELITQYQNLSSPDMILSILGLMAATLQENAPLIEVLRVHLSIIDQVQKLTNSQSTVYRKIVLRYFLNYWKTSVERVMFRFNNPQITAYLLCQSQNMSSNEQGQAILNIIRNDLIY